MALLAGDPPPGHGRWSLRLLADQLVLLEVVEGVSPETVRLALKRVQALAGEAVVHPARAERRLCRGDGGYPQCLCGPARSGSAPDLLR